MVDLGAAHIEKGVSSSAPLPEVLAGGLDLSPDPSSSHSNPLTPAPCSFSASPAAPQEHAFNTMPALSCANPSSAQGEQF